MNKQKKKEKPFLLYGIFGCPLGHTLSPAMQEAAFEHFRIPAFYLTLETLPHDFKKIMRNLRAAHACVLDGFNLTVPYKEKVMPFLDGITPEAKAVGAVNTVFKKNKKWIGANTDVYGFVTALKEEAGFQAKGKTAVILGAGGAAKAVAYGLASSGIKGIYIANRHPQRAMKLARALLKLFPHLTLGVLDFDACCLGSAISQVDLVVNATSVGLKSETQALIPDAWIPKAGKKQKLFYDLIYHRAETGFMKLARKKGHKTLGGLGMLLYQGAKAFEYWTGRKAPVEIMKKKLIQNVRATHRVAPTAKD